MEAGLLLACGLLAAVACAGLGLIVHRERAAFQTVQLHFGRDVTPEAMTGVVDCISGLHMAARVVLDVQSNHAGIRHYLHSDQATLETLRGSLRAVLPSLRLE